MQILYIEISELGQDQSTNTITIHLLHVKSSLVFLLPSRIDMLVSLQPESRFSPSSEAESVCKAQEVCKCQEKGAKSKTGSCFVPRMNICSQKKPALCESKCIDLT